MTVSVLEKWFYEHRGLGDFLGLNKDKCFYDYAQMGVERAFGEFCKDWEWFEQFYTSRCVGVDHDEIFPWLKNTTSVAPIQNLFRQISEKYCRYGEFFEFAYRRYFERGWGNGVFVPQKNMEYTLFLEFSHYLEEKKYKRILISKVIPDIYPMGRENPWFEKYQRYLVDYFKHNSLNKEVIADDLLRKKVLTKESYKLIIK